MLKFLIKIGVFAVIISLVLYSLCTLADGYTDPFYKRFTTPKQHSLILGTSKAAQAIQPQVFDSILDVEISNYSFTVLHSPFGETYYKSIRKKLDTTKKRGLFIITVDPWSISSFTEKANDSTSFRELNTFMTNTTLVDIDPNPIYLIRNLEEKYKKLFFNTNTWMFLHNDGWLELDKKIDTVVINKRIIAKDSTYRKDILPKAKFSENRFRYLIKTVNLLQNYGEVYLVRLPVHPTIMKIENEFMPFFDATIDKAIKASDHYLNLTEQNNNYIYNDGNHLHKTSGKKVSEIIANWVKDNMKTVPFN